MRVIIEKFLNVICLAVVAVILTSSSAMAISNDYPDVADTPPSPGFYQPNYSNVDAWLAVGEAESTRVIDTTVKMHFTEDQKSNAQFTLVGKDFCGASGIDDNYSGGNFIESQHIGSAVSLFSLASSTGTRSITQGYVRNYSYCNYVSRDVAVFRYTIPESWLDYVPATGYWTITFQARHMNQVGGNNCKTNVADCDGLENYFRLWTNEPNKISHASHSAGSRGKNSSMNYKSSSPVYTDYSVKFGSDCTFSGSQTRYITFYDLDTLDTSIQPKQIILELWDRTIGAGYLIWSRTPPAAGSSTLTQQGFTAVAGHKYELIIRNAYSDNLIQYSVPFDGVYYDHACNANPNLSQAISLAPDPVYVGGKVTANLSFWNTGLTATGDVRFNWWIEYFSEANGTGTRIGAVQRSNLDGSVAARSTRVMPAFEYTVLMPQIASICTQAQIQSASAQLINFTGLFTPKRCVNVAKDPGLYVAGGDVRVGGAFPTPGQHCYLTRDATDMTYGGPYSVIGHNYGSPERASFAQYAISSPGQIHYFGSLDSKYIATNARSTHLQFATGGFNAAYGNSSGFMLGDASGLRAGQTQTYCMPDVANIYSPPNTTPTPIGSGTSVTLSNLATANNTAYSFTGSNGILALSAAAGSQLPAGKKLVINASQTEPQNNRNNRIVIRGPITYQATGYTSFHELPQFVVVANGPIDIQFEDVAGAGSLVANGVFATGGNIYTCGNYGNHPSANAFTSAQCNRQLVVRGALIAGGRVMPYRTFGFSTPTDLSVAEEFRLTPETILSDYARSLNLLDLTVDYQNELPTRL